MLGHASSAVTAVDHLWAGWRATVHRGGHRTGGDVQPLPAADGRSLFERILGGLPDDETFIVLPRRARASCILNALPVHERPPAGAAEPRGRRARRSSPTTEHDRAVGRRGGGARRSRPPTRCDGVNVGLNLGAAAGAGVPTTCTCHCLPRWTGDTNFMTAVAETRVLPEPLSTQLAKLRDAWPSPIGSTGLVVAAATAPVDGPTARYRRTP